MFYAKVRITTIFQEQHEIQLFYYVFAKKKLVFAHISFPNWLKVELRLVFSTFQFPVHLLLCQNREKWPLSFTPTDRGPKTTN